MADQRNPFTSDDPNSNPWKGGNEAGGPAYGNAYEDNNNNNGSWNYGSMRMPEPSVPNRQNSAMGTMNSTYSGNAWENDKTEVPAGDHGLNNAASPSMANANANPYQYAGTRYGNNDTSGNAYSAAPEPTQAQVAPGPQQPNKPDASSALPPIWNGDLSSRPSKSRLGLRIVQLIACIGSIGFAAGASSVSLYDDSSQSYCLDNESALSVCVIYLNSFSTLINPFRSITRHCSTSFGLG